MPHLVTVGYRSGGRRRRIFVPVLPVLLVLAPLLVLAAVAGLIACLVFQVSATGALRGLGRVVWALPGTRFDLEDGTTDVHVHIR